MKEILDNKKNLFITVLYDLFSIKFIRSIQIILLASGYSGQNNVRNYTYKEVKS